MALQADSTFGRIRALSAARRAETSVDGTTVRIFPGAPHVNARGLDVRVGIGGNRLGRLCTRVQAAPFPAR
jgi:hypothetical protein